MLLDEFHHHAAPLAIGAGVIERTRGAAMVGPAERDMVDHEERAGAELTVMCQRGCADIGHEIGDLSRGQIGQLHVS